MDYKLPKLPERKQDSNKGTFGKILNISGSYYMTGAAYLSSVSALKVGAGYVELASEERVLSTVANLAPEVVLAPLSKISELLKTSDAITIGCGLSTSKQAEELFSNTIKSDIKAPIVIDADGINLLSKNEDLIKYVQNKKVILTPHPKEASRLLGLTLEEVLNNIEEAAKQIALKYNCITVLKTHRTVILSPDGKIYRNTTGNSALAKAGSGDVLAGIITGLVAQKMDLFDAAVLGVYLHGLAGELAAKDLSEYGVLASDTLRYIPFAIKNYLETIFSF